MIVSRTIGQEIFLSLNILKIPLFLDISNCRMLWILQRRSKTVLLLCMGTAGDRMLQDCSLINIKEIYSSSTFLILCVSR